MARGKKGPSKYDQVFPLLWQELGLTEDASFDDVNDRTTPTRKDKTQKKSRTFCTKTILYSNKFCKFGAE